MIIGWLVRSSSIRPNFDTGGSKLGRNFDQTSTKLRPNFDPPVSKFGRSLLDISMKHIVTIHSSYQRTQEESQTNKSQRTGRYFRT